MGGGPKGFKGYTLYMSITNLVGRIEARWGARRGKMRGALAAAAARWLGVLTDQSGAASALTVWRAVPRRSGRSARRADERKRLLVGVVEGVEARGGAPTDQLKGRFSASGTMARDAVSDGATAPHPSSISNSRDSGTGPSSLEDVRAQLSMTCHTAASGSAAARYHTARRGPAPFSGPRVYNDCLNTHPGRKRARVEAVARRSLRMRRRDARCHVLLTPTGARRAEDARC